MKKRLAIGVLILISSFFTCIPNATAQNTDNAYKQALKELMLTSGGLQSADLLIPQLIGISKSNFPTVPDSFWETLEKKMKGKFIDRMIEGYIPIYQKYLTLDDLKQLIEFYQKPIGKKFAQVVPYITAEGVQMGQKLRMEMAKEIEEEAKFYKPL